MLWSSALLMKFIHPYITKIDSKHATDIQSMMGFDLARSRWFDNLWFKTMLPRENLVFIEVDEISTQGDEIISLGITEGDASGVVEMLKVSEACWRFNLSEHVKAELNVRMNCLELELLHTILITIEN